MQPILTIQGLRKSFGPVEVLRGVDLTLARGEVLALVGDNGAGKSTLIKHVAGVHRADSGHIELEGERIDGLSPRQARARGIETVYQDLALADDLSVGANVFLGREPMRQFLGVLPYVDERRIRAETAALLERLQSTIPTKTKTVARLSGGQRQAVAIARAIYWKAKVVIMDEPTAAGVIYVGHNLVEILEVADRVAVMFRGSVVHVTNAKDTNQDTLIKYMTGYVDRRNAARRR
jgi:ABC-type sugar transport system ATPase subunit